MSVFSRTESARLAAWTPDGKMLVSRPKEGEVDILTPNGSGPAASDTLLDGLDQPHGLAFDGTTLYVAESSRINAYAYADGRATGRRTVVDGLPDAKSTELGGQYAHALKSVAVGKDGALYYSIGSSGNISEEDRTANPERAAICRIPPGGGSPRGARARRAQRHRSRRGARRQRVDRGQPPRQHPVPVRHPVRRGAGLAARQGPRGLRRRPPGRAAGEAHPGSRPGLAVLQPGPGRAARRGRHRVRLLRAEVRQRRGDSTPTAASSTARSSPRSSRAWARTRRRWG